MSIFPKKLEERIVNSNFHFNYLGYKVRYLTDLNIGTVKYGTSIYRFKRKENTIVWLTHVTFGGNSVFGELDWPATAGADAVCVADFYIGPKNYFYRKVGTQLIEYMVVSELIDQL